MKRGDVLYWPDFRYKDGGSPTAKLMLVAGVDKYKDALLYRTTSQGGGYRPDPEGCHADASVYRFKDKTQPFTIPTWIQFEDPYIRCITEIEKKGITVHFSLTEVQMQAVINCLKRSPEFAKYLADYGI